MTGTDATRSPRWVGWCANGVAVAIGVAIAACLLASPALGQELEPRAYSIAPVGTNFVAVTAGNTRGEVLLDPSLPIDDVKADLNLGSLGYGRTFGLGGRQALAAIVFSYGLGDIEGEVLEEQKRIERSGLADMRLKMSVNLVGPPAMTPQEFATAPRKTVLGVSMTVQPPTGQYDETKLINLGTNRWAFKPEVGVSVPVGRWFLDAYLGAWFFTNNDSYFPGDATRRQDPLLSAQGHVSYTFESRAWLAFDATWYAGGEGSVDDGDPSERQNNTRMGGTFSLPITTRQAIKVVANTGASARTGSDFDTYLIGWQFTWFDR